ILLVIYITNLYRRKISTFLLSKDEILVKKDANFFAREEDSMPSVDSNFNFLCGRPHGAGPPPPSTCVHLSLTPPLPLRVDVINGWPLTYVHIYLQIFFFSSYLLLDSYLPGSSYILFNCLCKYLLAYLLVNILTCLPTPTCLPTDYQPTYKYFCSIPTYFFISYLPTYFLNAYLHAYLLIDVTYQFAYLLIDYNPTYKYFI